MAKKKFEQEPYNPLSAELLRDAAIRRNRKSPGLSETEPKPPEPPPEPAPSSNVVDLQPRPHEDDQADEPSSPKKPPQQPQARSLRTPIHATRRKTAEPSGPTKRYKVTAEEDHELGKFILQLRQASNTKVSLGLLNRVTNTLLQQALPEIIAEINNADPLYQPPNNDALAYAEFEESWARIIERALRRRRNPR